VIFPYMHKIDFEQISPFITISYPPTQFFTVFNGFHFAILIYILCTLVILISPNTLCFFSSLLPFVSPLNSLPFYKHVFIIIILSPYYVYQRRHVYLCF
jgi:hypothetical protein